MATVTMNEFLATPDNYTRIEAPIEELEDDGFIARCYVNEDLTPALWKEGIPCAMVTVLFLHKKHDDPDFTFEKYKENVLVARKGKCILDPEGNMTDKIILK